MNIGELKRGPKKVKKRVGRGPGSGNGKTSGRGHKGYHSRSGSKRRPWFEGGQMPLQRRLPKRGFTPYTRNLFQLVNISLLERFDDGATVTAKELKEAGLIRKISEPVKILGDGELTKKLTIKVDKFTKTAEEKITKAGGTATVAVYSAE